MKIGYARVSTQNQNLDLQLDALRAAGCERIYEEKASGAKRDRPVLANLLENLRPGDTLVVWKLDRLSRPVRDLLALVEDMDQKGIGFVSLTNPIDTTTASGRFMLSVFAALGQMERELTLERSSAGREAARARGRVGGRPKGLTPEAEQKAKSARALWSLKNQTADQIAKSLGISRSTFYEYIKESVG